MKITKLRMRNFLGFQHEILEFPKTITLIAGRNGSGKTAIHDAILFALTDAKPRGIRTKTAIKELMTEGAAKGDVTIMVDGEETYQRSLKSGNWASESPPRLPVLPFVLRAHTFAALSAPERRKFLEAMAGVEVEAEDVVAELTKRDCEPKLVAEIQELLVAGFDVAEKQARDRATEQKGAWAGVTGEKWGSVKGKDWKATAGANEDDEDPGADIDSAITDAESELARLQAQMVSGEQIEGECPQCETWLLWHAGKFQIVPEGGMPPQTETAKQIKRLRRHLENLRERQAGAKYLEKKTAEAAQIHQRIVDWLKIVEELGPEGVPRLYFDKARGPINYRLGRWGRRFGHIEINPAADVTFNGRRYELCSESQRWICDAFLAEAIAAKSGLKLLLLDRMDVLDLPNRGIFVSWLASLSTQYDTIIVTATMKTAPAFPKSMDIESVWLGEQEAS